MSRIACWMLALGLAVGIASVHGAQIGNTMEEVRARHGRPVGQMSSGDRAIWLYSGFSVIFEEGRVIQTPAASMARTSGADQVTAPARASAPTVRDRAGVSRSEILPDPGTLQAFQGRNNEVFRFRVTGSTTGVIWGTDVYTEDSTLAVAAVHAGVLKPGEQGVVRVRILPGRQSYQPSTRNGVTSEAWGPWGRSFSVLDKETQPAGR